MKSANQALLVVMVVVTLGLWGCAQAPAPNVARLRELEARHARLEEDYRAATTARDLARKRVVLAEQAKTDLQQQLDQVTREREELRQQISARTGERDTLHNHLIQLGKELHTLAGRIDAAAGPQVSQPATTAVSTANPDKS